MTAKRSIIPVFIPHLGCPHECVFCNQRRISGSLLPAEPEEVALALQNFEGRGAQLAFYGGSFTALKLHEQERFLLAARPFLDDGIISTIRISTRPDCINVENLALLQKYSVSTIELGAQSMDDEVLRLCRRGHSAADTVSAARMIKAFGFELVLQMMTGLYGSSEDKDAQTAERLVILSPDAVRIYPTVIIKDTWLCDLYMAGEYKQHTVEDAVNVCARIVPIFEGAGIDIIRLGLNPTDDLSGGEAVAGAYHPALGELVRSRIFLISARNKLQNIPPQSKVMITVNPSCISQMTGQGKCNIKALTEEYSLARLKIVAGEIKKGEIIVQTVAKEQKM